jgi:hypothetical protein
VTERETELLLKIADLELQLADQPNPKDFRLTGNARRLNADRHWNWAMRQAHGPRVVELYAPGNEAARKRTSRSLAALEVVGLVELWSACGGNITHAKLTEAGRSAVAAALPAAGGTT